jgi:hypothetical protein
MPSPDDCSWKIIAVEPWFDYIAMALVAGTSLPARRIVLSRSVFARIAAKIRLSSQI